MIALDKTSLVLIAALLAAWLIVAVWATMIGLRRASAARGAKADAERLSALVSSAPALPLLVDSGGHLSGDQRLAGWLGLVRLPEFLNDLLGADNVFERDDAASLARDVNAAQRAGRSFSRSVRIRDSRRVLMIRGSRANERVAHSAAILWFFDATENLQEIEHLERERAKLSRAIEALSALIEAAPFPMWHRGPDFRLALVNTAYVHAVEGDSAADVVARGLELVEPAGGMSPAVAAAAAQSTGTIGTRTVPATIAGARRMIRIVDVPLGAAGVAGYAVDVEELEEARADLSRFVRAQRDLLDRLSAGVAQFAPDRGLIFYNQPFLRLFALQPEWLFDRPEFDRVLERMREAQRLPEARDFPGWKDERRAWFTQGNEAIEEAWLLPGGAHLRVVAQPLPDGGLLLIFEDRTEQLQLASARDTLLRVRTATFDNLFEAIGVFAADGRIHLWNSRFREVWGLEEDILAGHPRVDALVEMVGKRLANPTRASLVRELVRIATIDRQQRSGRVALIDGRHFEFAVVPLPDGNALFTMLDITASRGIEAALRERNEALEEADKLKNAFVANMSYELRVPLTSIGGFAEMIAGGYAGPIEPAAQEYVDAILASVARLSKVVEDVLDLTQSEAGSLPMAQEDVDFVKLAAAAAEKAEIAAKVKTLEFVAQIDPKVGIVKGDARRLGQALDHLLRNAVGYTPSGGRVLFRVSAEGSEIVIIVSDDGPGIAPKERERIFDRFHRTSAAPRPRDGIAALGIGLPLTRQLVEIHGGTIEIASEPGEGTTVIVHLPRANALLKKSAG
jgi:signal transduction histidine kinase